MPRSGRLLDQLPAGIEVLTQLEGRLEGAALLMALPVHRRPEDLLDHVMEVLGPVDAQLVDDLVDRGLTRKAVEVGVLGALRPRHGDELRALGVAGGGSDGDGGHVDLLGCLPPYHNTDGTQGTKIPVLPAAPDRAPCIPAPGP